MKTIQHLIPNGNGWLLSLTQTWVPEKLDRSRRPVLIVPGYGMNSFIFGYHPSGPSMEGHFAEAGREVWRVDLRDQGAAIRQGGDDNFSMADLADTDLGATIDALLERTRSQADRVDVIGASLGGTLSFIHVALNPNHRLGSIVAMGSPLRWTKVHPAIRLLVASPTLIGLVRFRGSRKLAALGLPLLARHTPWLLRIYMNPEASDLSAAREMVKTVENPNRHINREIARWIGSGDLEVRGVNVVEAMRLSQTPLLCVVANGDGIVPISTASFAYEQSTAAKKSLLKVGDAQLALAHADLFISNVAQDQVFAPMLEWMNTQTA